MINSYHKRKLSSRILFLTIGGIYAPAFAQSTVDNSVDSNSQTASSGNEHIQLAAITVTGYGTEQQLGSTSGSISVITSDNLQSANAKEVKDLNGRVPGFAVGEANTAGDVRLYIRGQGDHLDMEGKRVGVFIDGIPQAISTLQNPNLSDIEQVEVLKGSQNVLFGPGSSAGAINITTKKPTNTGGSVTLGLGNNKLFNAAVNYDHVVDDTLYLGFSGSISKDGGFVNNIYNNKTLADSDRKNFALKATYSPTEDTFIDFRLFGDNTKLGGPLVTAVDPKTLTPLSGHAAYLPLFPNATSNPIPFWSINTDLDSFSDAKTIGANLKVTHYFDDIKFTSNTGWTSLKWDSAFDGDGTDLSLNQMTNEDKTVSLFQDFRLSGETEKLGWIVGADFYKDKFDRSMRYYNQAVTMFPQLYPKGYDTEASTITQTGAGLFSQLTWSPVDKLDLTGGIRLQHDRSSVKGNYNVLKPDFSGITPMAVDNSMSKNTVSWSGKATWKFTPDIHVYGAIASGYKPAGFNQAGSMNNYAAFDKEHTFNKEIGFKGQWLDNKLFTTAAIFDTDVKDLQAIDLSEGIPATRNIGKVNIRGIELSADYAVTDNFSAGFNYSKISTNIKDFANPNAIGKKLPYVPDYNMNLHANLVLPTNFGDLNWFTQYTLNGPTFADYTNTIKQGSYGLLDSSLAWKHKNHQLTLWGKNILNKEYYSSIYDASLFGTQYTTASIAPGRTFGLNYRYSF